MQHITNDKSNILLNTRKEKKTRRKRIADTEQGTVNTTKNPLLSLFENKTN